MAFAVAGASMSSSLRASSAFVNSLTIASSGALSLSGSSAVFDFGEDQREQMLRFLDFEFDGLPGLQLLLHVIDERREIVAPRHHDELVTAHAFERNARAPQIEAGGLHGAHRRFVPVGFVGGAPLHGSGDLVVAFREDRGLNLHRFADDALRRKAPMIDRRRHAFDRHARRGDRLGHRLLVGGLRAAFHLRLREQDEGLGLGAEAGALRPPST